MTMKRDGTGDHATRRNAPRAIQTLLTQESPVTVSDKVRKSSRDLTAGRRDTRHEARAWREMMRHRRPNRCQSERAYLRDVNRRALQSPRTMCAYPLGLEMTLTSGA